MKCPKCGSVCISVKDSRPAPKNEVRRNRVCQVCKYRWTTYEMTAANKAKLEQAARQTAKVEYG